MMHHVHNAKILGLNLNPNFLLCFSSDSLLDSFFTIKVSAY